jgi:MFS family permease
MASPASLSEPEIRNGLRLNMLAGTLGVCWMAMTVSLPLTMLLEALGAGGTLMGLSVTVQQLAMAVQIPAALQVEKLSRRKPFWAGVAIPHRLIWLLPGALLFFPGLSPNTVVVWTLVAVTLSSVLAHASVPAWFSWMADLVPTGNSGRFWGLRQSVTTAAFVLGMGVTGWILDRADGLNGFKTVFILGALLGSADILVHMAVPEPAPHRHPHRRALRERLRAPWHNPDFVWLTLALGAWAFSASLHASFTPVYLKRVFGIEYRHLVLLPVAGALSAILSGIPIGKCIDKLGARGLGVLLMLLGPALAFFWFLLYPGHITLGPLTLPRPIAVLLISHILAGGLYAGIGLCQIHLINTITARDGRTLAMAMHWSTVGAMAALGPPCGGAFMDFWTRNGWDRISPWGASFTFFQALVLLHVLLAWGLAIPLLRRVKTRTGECSARMILAGLRIGNPFRPLFPTTGGYVNTMHTNPSSPAAPADPPEEESSSE